MAQRTSNNPEYKDLGSITAVLGCYEYEDAFDDTNQTTAPIALSTPAVKKVNRIHFKASRSSAIYGKSPTVQPSAISLIPQIRFQGGDTAATKNAGLPNITGSVGNYVVRTSGHNFRSSGALNVDVSEIYTFDDAKGPLEQANRVITLDASKSNNIYGQSHTVQPPSICLIPQIRFQLGRG